MARQPDNILLNFRNVETLDGNNTLNYYYREGVIYIDGEENIPEFKRLDLNNEQLSRTTRLIKREDNLGGQTYTTVEGQIITLQPNDELYVSHNYTGDSNLDKNFDTNSWWYDINWHKSYRTYLVVRYLNATTSENGEDIYDLRVVDTRTVYKADDEDNKSGVYTFTTIPPDDIGITASVLVDQKFNGNTWETVNLNLYYNNAIIAQETLDTTSTSLPERITLLVDYSKDAIVINDTLKMSVEVDDAPALHDDSLLITEYTMSISSETEVDAPETILGFNENLSLNRNFDCQPTLNNVTVSRQSEFVQDVDYSISEVGMGINTPQNLSLILNNKATKATVPDSNYSQYSSIIPKYYGSKTNRTGFNLPTSIRYNSQQIDLSSNVNLSLSPFYFTTDNLGSFPNVESKNSYIGYFEKIIDPYPVLNGKTAYFVKYLLDENTDVLDPSLTIQGLNNLKNTFKPNDLNNLPTSVKASVQNIDEARELKDLENFATVYTVAEYPTPILYSQTSSNQYSTQIQLSGSSADYLVNFDMNTEGYRNLAFTAEGRVNSNIGATSLGNNTIFQSFEQPDYIASPNEKVFENRGFINIVEEPTDEYTLTVNYNFYTTHLPPQYYRRVYNDTSNRNRVTVDEDLFTRFGNFDFIGDDDITTSFINLKPELIDANVQLIAWSNSSNTPLPTGEGTNQTVTLVTDKVYNEPGTNNNIPALVERYNKGIRINFDSEQIYNALNTTNNPWDLWLRTRDVNKSRDNIIASGIGTLDQYGNNFIVLPDEFKKLLSYENGNYLEWRVSFKMKTPKIAKYSTKRIGKINITTSGLQGNAAQQDQYVHSSNFVRSFNPPQIDGSSSHVIKYDYRGLKTPSTSALGKANAPFWKHPSYSGVIDRTEIYLVPNLLNTNYDRNYYQVELKYVPGPNTTFPFSEEPPFTSFPSTTDSWKVEIGDEIRFENLESKTYTVTNVYSRNISDERGTFERIVLSLDTQVALGTVLDFFLIRRFKPSNNFVILNQQKPYGVPPSASSSPGILQTQYQNEELETNPDKVITNLIERNLI